MTSPLIDQLATLLWQDNVVFVVGTGLHGQGKHALDQQIAAYLAQTFAIGPPDRPLSLVARDVEVQIGRAALLSALRDALQTLTPHPAAVHQLLADALPPFAKVVTTRFDRVLETALDQFGKAYVRIRRDTDLPFFDESRIAIIKLQGDIEDPDHLCITDDDVRRFLRTMSALHDVVRAYFATKTLLFVGYNLEHPIVRDMFDQIEDLVGQFRRPAFALVPRLPAENEVAYWQRRNVMLVETDLQTFFERLTSTVKRLQAQPVEPSPNPLESRIPLVRPERPYKALDSFSQNDAAIFAGRQEESRRLTHRILARRHVVLYGSSGSGKTSLLMAGVAPRLAALRALLVAATPYPTHSLTQVLGAALRQEATTLDVPFTDTDDLAALVRRLQQALEGPVVLVLDQFEQFFAHVPAAEQPAQLADVMTLVADRTLDLRLVFVLREEFVGHLDAWREAFPTLLDVRFYLTPLNRETARLALEEPAALFGVTWKPALLERLLDDLTDENGRVAPPHLQIVADALYRAVVEAQGRTTLNVDDLEALGGTGALLGHYLDDAIATFPTAEQPQVRTLLGLLVGSSGLKARVALDDLARAADMTVDDATRLLEQLVALRLVRRYETPTGVQYELTHDYLAAHITRWLGEAFWAAQKAREILRTAVREWRDRGRLLPPDDLALIERHRTRLRFSPDEQTLCFASAIAYGEPPADRLPPDVQGAVLVRLLEHAEPFVRARAALAVARLAVETYTTHLPRLALDDPNAEVRQAAVQAIATLPPPLLQQAVTPLVGASQANHPYADAAIYQLRDMQPLVEPLLPAAMRARVRRAVWQRRWTRRRDFIAAQTLHAARWGALVGGVLIGMLTMFSMAQQGVQGGTLLATAFVGLLVGGMLGALAGALPRFVGVLMRELGDGAWAQRARAVMLTLYGLCGALALWLVWLVLR
nr:SIR2 family protein [Ardenticatena sp.]